MKFLAVKVSHNEKVGPLPITYSDPKTCPNACPLKAEGCYSKYGPSGMAWKKTNKTWNELLSFVKALPKSQLWRHNVAGDLPGTEDRIDVVKLGELVQANKGKRGWTYTHKPVGLNDVHEVMNARAIESANKEGFTINLSSDSLVEADELAELGIGPVVVVLPIESPDKQLTPKGRHVIACPAEKDGMTCEKCMLCQKAGRKAIVGFHAHGVKKTMVNRMLTVIQ